MLTMFEKIRPFLGRMIRAGVLVVTPIAMLVSSGSPTRAQADRGGWPQWGGPTRNFQVESARIARAWPEAGPRQRWRRSLGEGYSSILVDGDTLVTMFRRGDAEVIVALDAATGGLRWEHAYDAPLTRDGYFDVWFNSAGPGPYSTPLIADGVVFAVGVTGRFHALDLKTGALRWSHDLVARFKLNGYNAFASSPLAYKSEVILPLGGSGEGVVAFRRDTGDVAWRSDPLALAPGSPIVIDVDGQPQLVVWCQQELVALNPDDGRTLWRHPHASQLGLNISTPVWERGKRLFAASAYGGGSRMIRLSRIDGRTKPEELWSNNRMRLHFGCAIRIGNLVIGSSGDFGPAFIVALDVDTGAEVWRDRTFARAQMVNANGTLVIIDENGELALASVSDAGLRVHARRQILTSNAWTPPSVVGSTLYVRDRKEILALELSE
jgi:outer membrane protein assembly factor BamB